MSSRRAAGRTCTTQSAAFTILACLSLLAVSQTVQAYELAYEPCASIRSYWNCFQNEACIWHPIKVSDVYLLLMFCKLSSVRAVNVGYCNAGNSFIFTHLQRPLVFFSALSIFSFSAPRDNASISARDGRNSSAWNREPMSACGYRSIREAMVAFAPMLNKQLQAK